MSSAVWDLRLSQVPRPIPEPVLSGKGLGGRNVGIVVGQSYLERAPGRKLEHSPFHPVTLSPTDSDSEIRVNRGQGRKRSS